MPDENPLAAGKAVAGGHCDLTGKQPRCIISRVANAVLPILERFRISAKRENALSYCFAAISGRKSAYTFAEIALASLGAVMMPGLAHAQQGLATAQAFGVFEVILGAIVAGVLGTTALSAIWFIRDRRQITRENVELRRQLADLSASLHRSDALLNLRDQRVAAWASDGGKPELLGSLPAETGAPDERAAFLAFGRWLAPRSAAALEHSIAGLRERGVDFDLTVETGNGAPLEVQGRKSPRHVFVRFVSLSDAQRPYARLKLENQNLAVEYDLMLGLIDALKMPFWLRSADGRLKWVNRAYAQAVDAAGQVAAVDEEREFLGTPALDEIARSHQENAVFEQTVATVVGGDRRVFKITDFASRYGSAGIAVDQSDVEAIRGEYERTLRSHTDTLDQLTTAVASFDPDQKLRFFNPAFQKLWGLDQGFLDSAPDNALLLDRLRSEGKIAEQPEWRRWKETVISAYRAIEPQEHWWHLPDGRTIRVVANPQPKGGVTWVFENLTEKFALESRYNAVVRVQGETLDNLAEGVAVFGPDGRLRLSNPAFAGLWGLDPQKLCPDTHIAAIRIECDRLALDSPWGRFVASVTSFDEERRDRHGQVELKNGTVLRHALIHLPNGQVMMTFVDVTDSVKVERALKDKNEALRKADQLKNDFVQHVSYELRSPLTNIIGFTELLRLPSSGAGPLTGRQREYIDHIGSSSSVLLTIVNDILDLATVDAGIMELDIGEVPVERTIAAAVELVSERLRENEIALHVDAMRAPDSFNGDENRIRQILVNLLSNAANYAPEGSTVRLSCVAQHGSVEFAVHDDGPGMPPEVLDTVFQRFESHANGGRRRGAGLGLSIVKSFVELHGGSVAIDTADGRGTTVICRFPLAPAGVRAAAE